MSSEWLQGCMLCPVLSSFCALRMHNRTQNMKVCIHLQFIKCDGRVLILEAFSGLERGICMAEFGPGPFVNIGNTFHLT